MLAYRHAFHAGNHADVLKHVVLVQVLRYMARKDKPFTLVDTHAGAGGYSLEGRFARKKAVQLDWELDPRTFFGASLSTQHIANPLVGSSGRLFAQNTAALFDNVASIAPVPLNAQASLNTYRETPVFSQGPAGNASASTSVTKQ